MKIKNSPGIVGMLILFAVVAGVWIFGLSSFGVLDLFQLKGVPQTVIAVDAQVKELQTQSTSDEISQIEKDLNGTNLDAIDSEMDDVEVELNNEN